MKTKVFILSLSLISLMLISFSAISQETAEKEKSCKDNGFMKSLSEDQQTQIKAIKIDTKQKIAVYKADLKIKEGELDKLLLEENPSKDKIYTKVDEISAIKGDIHKEKLSREIDVKNLLTPEQQAEYEMHKMHKKKVTKTHKKGETKDVQHNCDHK